MVSVGELAAAGTVYTGLLVFIFKYIVNDLESSIDGKADRSRVSALESELDQVEKELNRLDEAHRQTRQVATTTYASVYGDEGRPDDRGLLDRSRSKREDIREDIEEIKERLGELEGGGGGGEAG